MSYVQIDRPIVLASRVAAGLAVLVLIVTLVADPRPSRWTFLLVGVGYSILLSFSVTGLVLLPEALRRRVFRALTIGGAAAGLAPLMLAAAIWYFKFPIEVIFEVFRPVLWVLGASLAAVFALACYGWLYGLQPIRRQ